MGAEALPLIAIICFVLGLKVGEYRAKDFSAEVFASAAVLLKLKNERLYRELADFLGDPKDFTNMLLEQRKNMKES